jgi:hypothetical protein
MRRLTSLGTLAVLVLSAGACGGDDSSGSGNAYVDEMEDVCKALENDLEDLDPATDVADNAKEASQLMEDAVADLKKIKLPSNARDAKDLVDNFGDQLDALDELANALGDGDDDAAGKAFDDLVELNDDANDLADDIDAKRCAFDADLFAAPLGGPTTNTDDTVPDTSPDTVVDTVPDTSPDPTVAPTAPPVSTAPPVDTTPAGPAGTKTRVPLTVGLTPAGDCAFADNNEDNALLTLLEVFLVADASANAATGQIAAVNVTRPSDGAFLSQVLLFSSDTPLAGSAQDNLLTIFDSDNTGVPTTVSGINGVVITRASTLQFFAADDTIVLWVIGADLLTITAGMDCLFAALPA